MNWSRRVGSVVAKTMRYSWRYLRRAGKWAVELTINIAGKAIRFASSAVDSIFKFANRLVPNIRGVSAARKLAALQLTKGRQMVEAFFDTLKTSVDSFNASANDMFESFRNSLKSRVSNAADDIDFINPPGSGGSKPRNQINIVDEIDGPDGKRYVIDEDGTIWSCRNCRKEANAPDFVPDAAPRTPTSDVGQALPDIFRARRVFGLPNCY